MEALNDDTIIDSINLNSSSSSHVNTSASSSKQHRQSQQHNKRHHYHQHHSKENNAAVITGGAASATATATILTSKKFKRLPWNCEVIRDRFTPQPYAIQLVERYLEPPDAANVIVLAQDILLKQYLMLAALQLQHQRQTTSKKKSLSLLVTHMGSNVSSLVELFSRHTTLKLAGIDNAPASTTPTAESLSFYEHLKHEANLIIISVNHLVEWLTLAPDLFSVCSDDDNDESDHHQSLLVFDHVTAVFHMRDSYERVLDLLVGGSREHNNKQRPRPRRRILGLGSLDIDSSLDDARSVGEHVDTLKYLFRCERVETATDLLDTFNIFNGFEPVECVEICDDAVASSQIHDFNIRLVRKIKAAFVFYEELISASNTDHSTTYIHHLCLRVLNECVYLLNEVGVWCLAKSLLPFICHIDKLAVYIESKESSLDAAAAAEETLDSSADGDGDGDGCMPPPPLEYSSTMQQILTLQSTATLLRELREMCIKHILHSKSLTSYRNVSFLANFTTPKVQRLVQLLKAYRSESFCCLIFVQNKQVATSLSLLLKKLAKEDHHSLGFINPNYIMGASPQQHASTSEDTTESSSSSADASLSSSCLKQEEILKKFYSGEINLLICTSEMEPYIESPSFVNLIVRFNCTPANASSASTSSFDYFSYIRTKSRAKSKHAYCHFLVEQSHFGRFFAQLNIYKQIESLLMNKCSHLIHFNKRILSHPVSITSKLILENSVFFINRYCIRLPSDALTQLTPRYDILKKSDETSVDKKRTAYKCVLRMPINSGLRESISSDTWEESEEAAKAHAAFVALLELYARGELNEYLEPITKEIFYKSIHRPDEDDLREWSQFNQSNKSPTAAALSSFADSCYSSYMAHRPGGSKRKQIYKKKISPYLDSYQLVSTQSPVYIYAIKFAIITPIQQKVHQHQQLDSDPSETPIVVSTSTSVTTTTTTTFGLVTSRPLLETVAFPIYTPNGEEEVRVELVKSNVYFSPNQLRHVKTFHKFVFSNVLRMEGRGAAASPFLDSTSTPASIKQLNVPNTGVLICLLTAASSSSDHHDDYKLDFDWDLMKSVDGCTDKAFMKPPLHAKRLVDFDEELLVGGEITTNKQTSNRVDFKFEREKYEDAVVIPFYRNNDITPQFYCVAKIDDTLNPDSPFPSASTSSAHHHHHHHHHHHNHHKASAYASFSHYFGYKYNIRISDPLQPLLLVSHPSTRLNLLTPRYMNMKATVLQKSSIATHPSRTTTTTTTTTTTPTNDATNSASGKKSGSTSNQSSSSSSSNQIYLVPELVNLHPLKASLWKRCMCLPSILFRLNCLLLAEELRREIATSTGVGYPWVDNDKGFDRLQFEWDARKELEMCSVPDVEIDLATIEHHKRQQRMLNNSSATAQSSSSSSSSSSNKDAAATKLAQASIEDVVASSASVGDSVTAWNFEISVWDDNCLNELNNPSSTTSKNTSSSSSASASLTKPKSSSSRINAMFSLPADFFKSLNVSASGVGGGDSTGSGWNDASNYKTLFIDPNDMELFGDELVDSDDEFQMTNNSNVIDPKSSDVGKIEKTVSSNDNSNNNKPLSNRPDIDEGSSNTSNSDVETNSEDNDTAKLDIDERDEEEEANNTPSTREEEDLALKFTIDMNTLKADMKRKSAKLLSKLSSGSSTITASTITTCAPITGAATAATSSTTGVSCSLSLTSSSSSSFAASSSMLKQLINELNVMEERYQAATAAAAAKSTDSLIPYSNTSCTNLAAESTALSRLDELIRSIDPKCFARVQFRCESKNVELLRKIDELKAKLSASLKANSSSDSIRMESKTVNLPLPKKRDHETTKSCLGQPNGGGDSKKEQATEGTSSSKRVSPLSLRNTDWSFSFSLDDDKSTSNRMAELGPGPAILLQALTLSNAGDGFDLERLETVGDSFLKQAITVYLFFTYPNVNEGKLSFLRSKQVSNYNLYKLGKRKGLQELIVSSKFEPLESWLPPHYYSSSSLNSTGFLFATAAAAASASSSSTSSSSSSSQRFDKYRDHCVSDKSIADCVEAIIGAYLITCGPQAALQVMSWFGLEVLPRVRSLDADSSVTTTAATATAMAAAVAASSETHQVLVSLPERCEPPPVRDPLKLAELLVGLDQFEATLGYKFRHPVYLVQAFTHASYTANTVTDCYQRLEFLGDAVLDYVITRFLFESPPSSSRSHGEGGENNSSSDNGSRRRLSPGELTDLRSALVNNNIFAYLAVKFDFYKYFKYTSPHMFHIIDSFVQNQKRRNDEFDLDEDFIDFPIDDDDDDEDEDGLNDGDDNDDYLDDSSPPPAAHRLPTAASSTMTTTTTTSSTMTSSNYPFTLMQADTNELEEVEVPKCLGDIFESVAGAVYLDSNRSLDTVWRVYYGLMRPYIEKFTARVPKSPIRELLEMEPETVKFEKPERTIDGKIRVCVLVFGKGKFKGVGRNYRIAKNAAAKLALKFLKNQLVEQQQQIDPVTIV